MPDVEQALVRYSREVEMPQYVRHQCLGFDLGEIDADADARASAERDQRIGRAAIFLTRRCETVGVECFGIGETGRQTGALPPIQDAPAFRRELRSRRTQRT